MKHNIFSIFNAKKVTGLYISPDTVDVVVLRSGLGGPKLIKFGQVYIYPKEKEEIMLSEAKIAPLSAKGDISTQESAEKKTSRDYIIEAIKKVFKENNIKPYNVVAAIASEEVMVRYFQMPKIPKQEWQAAVNFEAKRYIPFRMEDVVSDFQVISNPLTPNNMDVVFVAVKKDVIEEFIDIMGGAGIKPIVIEPAPFSLMRAFRAAEQIDTKINTAIVDINVNTVNIDILRNGVPYIIRHILLRGDISEEKTLEPIFERLLGEIKISLDFYEKQFPNEVIDKLIIYSTAPLENWHELVGKELQIPVEIGDPLRGIRIKNNVVSAKMAVCFGLALRGISEYFIDINLCKEKFIVYKKKELFLRMLFLEASAAVFLLILLKALSLKAITPLTNELNRTLSERTKIEINVKTDDLGELERTKNEMGTKKCLLECLISGRTYVTNRLIGFAELVPENIWLQEVKFEEKIDKKDVSKISRVLNIKGYCIIDGKISETDMVNNFLLKLKESAGVNKGMVKADIVSVKKININDRKVAGFEILFTGQ